MRAKVLVVAAAGLLALAMVSPAAAQGTAGTRATVTVEGGVLSITVRSDAGNLGTRSSTAGPGTISGYLGQVRVTDARNAPAGSGWVASVVSTAFTSPAGPAIPAGAVGYLVGPIRRVGVATYRADSPTHLSGVTAVVTATGISGANSATWYPTINVAVPPGTVAGVYSATITHSVA